MTFIDNFKLYFVLESSCNMAFQISNLVKKGLQQK
jgi:hypothetical protein